MFGSAAAPLRWFEGDLAAIAAKEEMNRLGEKIT